MKLTWERVLAWRVHRQFLERPETNDPVTIVRRMCGVHSQVASSAAMAVAVRQKTPDLSSVDSALKKRQLVKTWAMRGTLHLLPVGEAPAYLALLAAGKIWEKAAWQRAFVTTKELAKIADVVGEVLNDRLLTREELVAEVVRRTRDNRLAEHLSSGWGMVLKPLAWKGLLCHGPSNGNRVTFTRPETFLSGWKPIPEPDEAAATVLPSYVSAFGPASFDAFDQTR